MNNDPTQIYTYFDLPFPCTNETKLWEKGTMWYVFSGQNSSLVCLLSQLRDTFQIMSAVQNGSFS